MPEITPIAYFYSPLKSKFGAPRQSGVVKELQGRIIFKPEFRSRESLRGIEDFDYLWLIWQFSLNNHNATGNTVRPPRLGGNRRMGVWATRSPYRPNSIGLSSVKLEKVEWECNNGPILVVGGADLVDGTPIFDIKPYIPYTDNHPDARAGFTENNSWNELEVKVDDNVVKSLTNSELVAFKKLLSQDPRPHYHHDGSRVYGIRFGNHDFHFTVVDGVVCCTL